jgi:hypothetical protein
MTAHINVDLKVHVNGNAVATYTHEGRTYVEAREGSEYALFIKNNNPFRVKVVLSVDGINVVGGEAATGEREETGYILDAYQSTTIKGYRVDDNTVAAFRFTKADGGYAKAEKGLTGTTGVIGCRVWREKPAPAPVIKEIHHHHGSYGQLWPYRPRYYGDPIWYWNDSSFCTLTCGTSNVAGGAVAYNACAQASVDNAVRMMNCSMQSSTQLVPETNPFDAGSTWGGKVESKVTAVGFEAETLLDTLTIYYAFKAGLMALGVDTSRAQKVAFPQAFSGAYCKPPASWVG